MMNTGKAIFMILIICVVTPLAVDYLWPTSEGEYTNYNPTDTQNVTADFADGKVDVYSDVTDIYSNNYYVTAPYAGISTWFNNSSGGWPTSSDTGLPRYSQQAVGVTVSLTSHYYSGTVPQFFATYCNASLAAGGGIFIDPYGSQPYVSAWSAATIGGSSFDFLIYYPDSEVLLYSKNGILNSTAIDSTLYLYYDPGSLPDEGDLVINYFKKTNDFYDPSAGFTVPHDYSTWSNMYKNKIIDVLVKIDAVTNFTMDFKVQIWSYAYKTMTLDLSVVSNQITLKYYIDGVYQNELVLGNYTDFPFTLLRIDTIKNVISLAGMPGQSKFTDNYTELIRKTVQVEFGTIDSGALLVPIETFSVICNADPGDYTYWMVPRTYSAISQVDGINNKTVNLRIYDVSDFQIELKNVQLAPHVMRPELEINVYDNNNVALGMLWFETDGKGNLTWQYGGETYSWSLKSLKFQFVDDQYLYINGEEVFDFGRYMSKINLKFTDQWLVQIYESNLEKDTHPSYGWIAGSFGLDTTGYCAVGLMASFSSAMIAMLITRRSGTSAMLYLFVSGLCGVVYLLILMNGL